MDVFHVPTSNASRLVDAGRLFVPDDFDQIEDGRCQRVHHLLVAGEGECRSRIGPFPAFECLDVRGDIVVELAGRFHRYGEC